MKASIIIPFYNQKHKYLWEAIESCFSQEHFPSAEYEVIVIDDGSGNNVDQYQNLMMLETFRKNHENFRFISKTNGGTASALNVGIKQAKGEYIKWLSSDDVLMPNYLERMFYHMSSLTDLERSEVSIFFSDYNVIDDSGEIINTWFEPAWNAKTYWDRKKYLWMSFYGNASSSLIHRSVFQKCGFFDEELRHSEDYDFWLRCAMVYDYDMYHVPEPLIKYRIHSGQLSKQPGLFGSLDHELRSRTLRKMEPGQIYELYRRHDKDNP